MRTFAIKIITCILCLALVTAGGWFLGEYAMSANLLTEKTADGYWDGLESETEIDEVPVVIDDSKISAEDLKNIPELTKKLRERYTEAKEKNKDVVGWIYYPCSTGAYSDGYYVDEGIYYSGGGHYIQYDAEGRRNHGGQVYIDALTGKYPANVVLMHGHNMHAETRFGRLKKLTKKANFEADRYVYVYNADSDVVHVYMTFSCIVFHKDKYPIREYLTSEQLNEDAKKFNEKISGQSKFKCEYENTTTLCLHTCNRDFKNAHLMLSGYLVQCGEQKVSETDYMAESATDAQEVDDGQIL